MPRRPRLNRSTTRSRKSWEYDFGILPPNIEGQTIAHPQRLVNRPPIQIRRNLL
jgi:hypothetical protein